MFFYLKKISKHDITERLYWKKNRYASRYQIILTQNTRWKIFNYIGITLMTTECLNANTIKRT